MPTLESEVEQEELGRIINEACERGDMVKDIAERAGVPPQLISSLKNGSYPNSPTLDKVTAIAGAVGYKIAFIKAKIVVLAVIWSCLASVSTAQRLTTRGTADHYRQSMEGESSWRSATKLTILQSAQGGMLQPTQADGLDIEQSQSGTVGKVSYWNFQVDTVVDEKNVILKLGTNRRYWLTGYPTKDLVDGQAVRVIDPIEVAGTKSYMTVLGSRATIRVLQPPTKKPDASSSSEARDWLLKNGKVITGKFVDYRTGKLIVEQKDGKRVSIGSSMLVDSDKILALELDKKKASPK